jgi:hypothetical protein
MLLAACLLLAAYPAIAEQPPAVLDIEPTKPNRQILHFCKVDGTPLRPLVNDVALRRRLDRQGTPDVSADGKRVAYDAWPSDQGFAWH